MQFRYYTTVTFIEKATKMNCTSSENNICDCDFDDFEFELFEGNRITKALKTVGLYALCVIAIPIIVVIFIIRRLMGKDREFMD